MAPEIENNEGHGLPADIYSLGIIYRKLLGSQE